MGEVDEGLFFVGAFAASLRCSGFCFGHFFELWLLRLQPGIVAFGLPAAQILIGVEDGAVPQSARVLLLLANFDEHQLPRAALPIISRNLLAEMIGTSRWKVDLLMNNFRKLGFLERHSERDGGVQVHRSMLSVVLKE